VHEQPAPDEDDSAREAREWKDRNDLELSCPPVRDEKPSDGMSCDGQMNGAAGSWSRSGDARGDESAVARRVHRQRVRGSGAPRWR
jgi:hypothetical protein